MQNNFNQRPIQDYSPTNRRRHSKFWRIFKILFFIILIIILTVSIFSHKIISGQNSILSGIGRLPIIKQIRQVLGMENLKGELDDRINFLLLGQGGVNHDGPYLTDTIVLGSIKPTTNEVAMISIPRDFFVNISGHGWHRINAANSIGETTGYDGGGAALTAKVIEDVFDIPIHYWLRVDFNAFEKIINDLGGINVCVEHAFEDHNYPTEDFLTQTISFESGCQEMYGDTALKFVRSRHGTNGEGSDFARAARQQKVIMSVKDKILSLGTLTNPQRIYNLIKDLNNHIQTNIELTQIPHFLNLAQNIESENINRIVLDNSPYGLLRNNFTQEGAFILVPRTGNLDEIQILAKNIFILKNQSLEPVNIIVLNGTEIIGWATGMTNYLSDLGFDVIASGNSPQQTYEKSVIYDLRELRESQGKKTVSRDIISILKKSLDANVTKYIPEFLNADEIYEFDNADFLVVLGCKQDGECWYEDEIIEEVEEEEEIEKEEDL